jgi:hypothetical protein
LLTPIVVGVAVAGAAIAFLVFMVIPSRGQADPNAQRPDGPAINAPGVVDVAENKPGGHPINRIDEPLLIGQPSPTPETDVALVLTDAATETAAPAPDFSSTPRVIRTPTRAPAQPTEAPPTREPYVPPPPPPTQPPPPVVTNTPVTQPTSTRPAPTTTTAPPPPPTATLPPGTPVPPTATPPIAVSPTDPAPATVTATMTVPPIEQITATPTETPGGPTATPDLTKTATDGPTATNTPMPKRTRTPTPNPTGDTTPDVGTPAN